MGKRRFNRLFHSVFFRLIAAIVIAGLLMSLTVIGGFAFLRRAMFDTFQQNLAMYVRYIVRDIGDPPDLAQAQAIATQTDLVIHFESPQQQWTVPENTLMPDIEYHRRTHQINPRVKIGGGRLGHFISVKSGSGWLTFWRSKRDEVEPIDTKFFATLCFILLLILSGAYLYIRRVMQPVHWLTAAMNQYSEGHLDYRVPLKRSDEFQNLAESVNHMAGRIQALLESKEKLLLDVSHELRSPIARLKVGIEMLDDEDARMSLDEDLVEIEAMVTEILEAARLRQSAAGLNLQKIETRRYIRTIVSEYNQPAIQLGNVDECEISIDPQKIRTVLKNIFDNAIKYSGDSQRPVEVTTSKDNTCFQISVQDFGIGIPAEDLDRVFDPFFRVDPSRSRKTGGFGLGLSLCKAIMAAHNADIRIESKLGEGTRVVLRFHR